MKNFLKPTKQKIASTVVIIAAIFLASILTDVIATKLLPPEFLTAELENAINTVIEKGSDQFLNLALKILAINSLIYLSMIYLSVCVILHKPSKK